MPVDTMLDATNPGFSNGLPPTSSSKRNLISNFANSISFANLIKITRSEAKSNRAKKSSSFAGRMRPGERHGEVTRILTPYGVQRMTSELFFKLLLQLQTAELFYKNKKDGRFPLLEARIQ